MNKRIVIVGGHGFLGSVAARHLDAVNDVDVVVAGRQGPLRLDLRDPSTFTALDGADVVVNAASSHAASPAALASYCLSRGLVLLEASSDRGVVEELLALEVAPTMSGSVVVGAGIFTGLSNLLGRAAADAAPGAKRLAIGICSSPLSGAGQGTIDLMTDALAVPARMVSAGKAVDVVAGKSAGVIAFPRGRRRTLTFSFPEAIMLARSTGLPNVSVAFAPSPSPLWLTFWLTPSWVLTSRLYRRALGAFMSVLRRVLLRGVSSAVELVARAEGDGVVVEHRLSAADGFLVGGAAIAAMARRLARTPPPRGVHTIDEVCAIDDVVADIKAIAPDVRLELSRAKPRM